MSRSSFILVTLSRVLFKILNFTKLEIILDFLRKLKIIKMNICLNESEKDTSHLNSFKHLRDNLNRYRASLNFLELLKEFYFKNFKSNIMLSF